MLIALIRLFLEHFELSYESKNSTLYYCFTGFYYQ